MFDVTVDNNLTENFAGTQKELEQLQMRTISNTTRNLQTTARRAVRQRVGLRSRSANRRVLAFPNRGKLWLGARTVVITSLDSVKTRRATSGRGRRSASARGRRGGLQVVREGTVVDRAFAPVSGPTAGVPFVTDSDGRLQVIREDITDEMRLVFMDSLKETDNIMDRVFRQQFNSIVQKRSGG